MTDDPGVETIDIGSGVICYLMVPVGGPNLDAEQSVTVGLFPRECKRPYSSRRRPGLESNETWDSPRR